jgi:hypothetical protein
MFIYFIKSDYAWIRASKSGMSFENGIYYPIEVEEEEEHDDDDHQRKKKRK